MSKETFALPMRRDKKNLPMDPINIILLNLAVRIIANFLLIDLFVFNL